MKKLLSTAIFFAIALMGYAQTRSDSAAYELQRTKINRMLDVRAQKFGQYDQSLSQHTGIFGLQTKKDIRRSNEILMDIVKADNDIYKQIKILLDFRAFQQTQAVEKSKTAESTSLNLMYTIKRLQDQVQKLNQEATVRLKEEAAMKQNFYIAVILLIVTFILLWRFRTPKATAAK